jgi:protein-tyrosine phosphatase
MPHKILFVCLGNICRSPIAEGIFLHLCRERDLSSQYLVDSAGTGGWHAGQPPDARATAAAKRQGVHLSHVCRQVKPSDFLEFNLILAMDRSNQADLLEDCPQDLQGKIKLMRSFGPPLDPNPDVPDPYYGSTKDFDAVYTILLHHCGHLLEFLERAERDA